MQSIHRYSLSSSSLNRINTTLRDRDRSAITINSITSFHNQKNSFVQPSLRFSQFQYSQTADHDYNTIDYIIRHAYQKYLKQPSFKNKIQSHSFQLRQNITKNSKQQTFGKSKISNCFNILKILTSFKQLFPNTPQKIYKIIMFIGKQYNPQTLIQWKKAIQKIKHKNIRQNESTASILQDNFEQQTHDKQNDSFQPNVIFNNTAKYQRYEKQKDNLHKQKEYKNKQKLSGQNLPKSEQQLNNGLKMKGQRSNQKIKNTKKQENTKVNLQHYISFQPGSKQFQYDVQQYNEERREHKQNQYEIDALINNNNNNKNRTEANLDYQKQTQSKVTNHQNIKKASRSATMIESRSSKIVMPFLSTNPNTQFHTEQNSRIYNHMPKSKSIQNKNKKLSTNLEERSIIHNLQITSKQQNDYESMLHYRTYQSLCGCCKNNMTKVYPSDSYLQIQSQTNSHRINNDNTVKTMKQSHISNKIGSNYKVDQTQNQLLESQYFNISRQEWTLMNERATVFYNINTKFKVYSSLLANYQAFQYYKILKNKAKVYFHATLLNKGFDGFINNAKKLKEEKLADQISQKYFQNKRMKKCFKILQLFNQIKLQKQNKSKIKIQQFNAVNFQFLLSLMFYQTQSQSDRNNQNSGQGLDINKKVDLLGKTQKYQKICEIFKCFGANFTLSKQTIQIFFQLYHKCIMQRAFNVFKLYNQKKSEMQKIYNKRITIKAFFTLKNRRDKISSYKNKIQISKQIKQKNLMLKVFKVLVQMTYANKLFSKRCEYISTKVNQKLKKVALWSWTSQLKRVLKQKKIKLSMIQQAVSSLHTLVKRRCFNQIKRVSSEQLEQIQLMKQFRKMFIQKNIIKHLKKLIQSKNKYFQMRLNKQKQLKQEVIRKWFKYSKQNFTLTRAVQIFTKYVHKISSYPLIKKNIKNHLIQKQNNKLILLNCFKELKLNYIKNQNLRGFYTSQVKQVCLLGWRRQFILYFKKDYLQTLQIKRDIIQNNNVTNLQTFKTINNYQIMFKTFRSKITDLKQFRLKNESLKKYLKTAMQYKTAFLNKFKQEYKLNKSQRQFKHFITKQNQHLLIRKIKATIVQNKQKKLEKYLKSQGLAQFKQIIKVQREQILQKQIKSEQFYKLKIKNKFLTALAEQFIDRNNKYELLNKELFKYRTNFAVKKLVKVAKNDKNIQKKQIQVSKLSFIFELKTKTHQNLQFRKRAKKLKKQLFTKASSTFTEKLVQLKQQIECDKYLMNKIQVVQKKMVLMRFSNSFISSLFRKKHQYMAFKFRSLQLQSLAFRSFKHHYLSECQVINYKVKQHQNSIDQSKYGCQSTDYC